MSYQPKDVIETLKVDDPTPNARLSDYAVGKFLSLPSRKSVKKAIKRGSLLVNGQVSETGHWVKPGEELTVVKTDTNQPIYERKLELLFEDDYLAIVMKPADIPVSGYGKRNLQNALPFNLLPSAQSDAMALPRPVHRLDRQTGGLVLIAKTLSVAAMLGESFEKRLVRKSYSAIVQGILKDDLEIEHPVEGKDSFTHILPINSIEHPRFGSLTMVEARPISGRRNQIRIHLAYCGFPILGDLKFGGMKSGKGLFLFAAALEFDHPITGQRLSFHTPLPQKFRRLCFNSPAGYD